MKNVYFLLFIAFLSCKTNKVTDETAVSDKSELESLDQTCYKNRKMIKTVENQQGQIVKIGQTWLINGENNARFQPCELPLAFQIEGIPCIFSGEVKEIFQTERRIGTPFVMTQLEFKNE